MVPRDKVMLGLVAALALTTGAGACGNDKGTGGGTTSGSGGKGGAGATSSSSSSGAVVSSSSGAVAASSSGFGGAGGGGPFVCDPPAAPGSLYELSATGYGDVDPIPICKYRGDVVLIVNTAAA